MTLTKDDLLEGIQSLKVGELVELTQALKKKFSIADFSPSVAVLPDREEPPPVPEQTEFDVLLVSVAGPDRVRVIKSVREITALGLKEAKDLVDRAPVLVQVGLPKEKAEAVQAVLQGQGAVVEIPVQAFLQTKS